MEFLSPVAAIFTGAETLCLMFLLKETSVGAILTFKPESLRKQSRAHLGGRIQEGSYIFSIGVFVL